MELSTQTHFRQGWNTKLLDDVKSLGLDTIRDSLAWHKVEKKKGKYDFDHGTANWINDAIDADVDVMLVFDPRNPLYDKGFSVHSDKGREAFADFVVATLKEFPQISKIEIGNEYNGNNFVDGKIAKAPKHKRDDYYKELVEAVDGAIDEAGIDVTVIGASTHSIPIGYFDKLADNGALDLVDAVSIHPYTTDPEQLADQLALLRESIGPDKDIYATEFASKFENPEDAPSYLAKMVSVMAANGVTEANWYAFAKQSSFPNMELWDQHSDNASLAGHTMSLLEEMMAGTDQVEQIAVDAYTYFYAFGPNAAVVWGETRKVELADGIEAYDLVGNKITDFDMLSPETPVILRSSGKIDLDTVSFGDNYLLADSYHDFDVINPNAKLNGFQGPWSYFAENGKGKEYTLGTMGGDIGGGQLWTPYLGLEWLRPLQINSSSLAPADFSKNKNKPLTEYSVVERFTAQADGAVTVRGHWDVADRTKDGVRLSVELNGKEIFAKVIFDKADGHTFDLELTGIALEAGDTLDFKIDSRGNSVGDTTQRRIQIYDDAVPFESDEDAVSYAPSLPESTFDRHEPEPETGGDIPPDVSNPFDKSDANSKVVIKGGKGDDVMLGGSGNDKLYGKGGDDTVFGGDGNDKIYTDGHDRVDGGEGYDSLFISNKRGVTIDLEAASIEWVRGGKGDDVLDASNASADMFMKASKGSDVLLGGSGDDKLRGENGEDLLRGHAGDDKLWGGNGDDVLDGGAGNDKLFGNRGDDTFVFDDDFGHDVIVDFENGDVIDLSQINGLKNFADLDISYYRKDATITIDGSTITVENVGRDGLDADDFLI